MSNKFIKYQHVVNKIDSKLEGLLIEGSSIYIQPKLDGSNASIWWDYEKDEICCGSRNHKLSESNTLSGFYNYVQSLTEKQKDYIRESKKRLYGEWLVPHSISYKKEYYKKFYVFETIDPEGNVDFLNKEWISLGGDHVETKSLILNKEYDPKELYLEISPKFNSFCPRENNESTHEGIVIKSDDKNITTWLKVLSPTFKANGSARVQKDGKPEIELESLLTPELIKKEYLKLKDDLNLETWDMKFMGNLVKQLYTAVIEDDLVTFIFENNPSILRLRDFKNRIGSIIVFYKPWENSNIK